MRLSAPIYRLKRQAKLLSRDKKIALHEALDRIAHKEGFESWSLLAARLADASASRSLLAQLEEGDLLLLGARPGHGKTLMGLQLIVDAIRSGRNGILFTLEYTTSEVHERLRALGEDPDQLGDLLSIVTSDDISSDFIIRYLEGAERGTVAVIDYLQILDQQRNKPELSIQISALQKFARKQGFVLVFLSQIDRSYDPTRKPLPDVRDLRLPNRIDPRIFSKTCFMHEGEMLFQETA